MNRNKELVMNTVRNHPVQKPCLILTCITLASACLLSACAPTTPKFDATFGNTVRSAIAEQTLNPDASGNTAPVSGIDGRAAREAVDRYQKSFAQPDPQPSVFAIGIGK
jgi:hypothetical protein